MSADVIDRTIDGVAREMTAGEPHGAMRARVMARIDASGANRARWLGPRAALGTTAAAAAAIALIAAVAYREARPAAPTTRRPATVAADVHLRPDATAPRPAAPVAPVGLAQRRQTSAERRAPIAPSPIDALAPPPLAVAPMSIPDLSPTPIEFGPLDYIPPIAVAPLGEGDRP